MSFVLRIYFLHFFINIIFLLIIKTLFLFQHFSFFSPRTHLCKTLTFIPIFTSVMHFYQFVSFALLFSLSFFSSIFSTFIFLSYLIHLHQPNYFHFSLILCLYLLHLRNYFGNPLQILKFLLLFYIVLLLLLLPLLPSSFSSSSYHYYYFFLFLFLFLFVL